MHAFGVAVSKLGRQGSYSGNNETVTMVSFGGRHNLPLYCESATLFVW